MTKLLMIGVGGFIGALLRYGVSGAVQDWSKSISFPYGTLAVNLMGCFLIGWLSQLAESYSLFTPEMRAFLFVGILGAFTTFSTFGNETLNLLRDQETLQALVNIGSQVFLGLLAVWLGRAAALAAWR